MLTIQIDNIIMEYGSKKLFGKKELKTYSNDKIGIIGENGSGKSTLLDIIAGEVQPTGGSIKLFTDFSYIEQLAQPSFTEIKTNIFYKWSVPDSPKSGGEIMRQKIADAFAQGSGILLCDEPTSNLDEAGITMLEEALCAYKGTLLLVSHDRRLLDNVCSKIWEIEGGSINEYSGGYTDYLTEKEKLRQNQRKEYDKYTSEKKKLKEAVLNRASKAAGMKNPPKRMGNSEARLHRMDVRQRAGKVSKASAQIRSRLEKLEEKQKPKDTTSYSLSAPGGFEKTGRIALRIENLSFSYGDNTVLSDFSMMAEKGDKIAITGSNGSGKSTLLECIVNGEEGVYVPPGVDIGYFSQNGFDLDEESTILEYLMRYSSQPEHMTRTIIARLGIRRDDVYKKISVLSGGERCKVSLAKLICQNPSMLILDEPTNYLDLYILSALEEMLESYEGTLILVSHDRYFREKVTQREINLDC